MRVLSHIDSMFGGRMTLIIHLSTISTQRRKVRDKVLDLERRQVFQEIQTEVDEFIAGIKLLREKKFP